MKTAFVFFATAALSAAPIGNPASPALLEEGFFIPDTVWSQPRAAFIEDYIAEQRLVGSRHLAHISHAKIEGASSLGSASWSIRERFDLSLIAGSGEKTLRFSLHGDRYKAHFRGGLIWYGEAKLIIFEAKDTTLSSFGEAGGWNWMDGPFRENGHQLTKNGELMMRFWNAGATLSQKIGFCSLYGGVVVMRSRWKLDHTEIGNFLFSQKYPVGPLFGCSFSNASKFLLNAEWRGWVENAVSLTAEIRF